MLFSLFFFFCTYFVGVCETAHSAHFIITRVRAGEVGGAHYISKMASFIVDSCRDLRFSLEMWDWRRTIAWGRCTPLTIVDQFGITVRRVGGRGGGGAASGASPGEASAGKN